MTLGMMMAVQYIIGQLNAPISQLIGFVQSAQDAKISLERLGEIHNREDEVPGASTTLSDRSTTLSDRSTTLSDRSTALSDRITMLPQIRDINIQNLTFQYEGPHSDKVLDQINLEIPSGKITAIVGMSGSGKTTLVKLLLGFYPPISGEIKIGEYNLQNISNQVWRENCGAVMQDGFIFSDTIANNIAIGTGIARNARTERLLHAAKVANILEMIEGLPLGFNTKIGQEGQGISQGQRQRVLIARAVYKNPEFIFFDEATNALDANNEKVIMENLNEFFEGKTVVVVAHRLSTVKNADNIVVLEKGRIVEQGTHKELTKLKGIYYELVKNQLELGN
jgi:ATP-binding cassette subfamily B protein